MEYPIIKYIKEEHTFYVTYSKIDDEVVKIKYYLGDTDHKGLVFDEDIDNFGYKILYRPHFKENEIIEIIDAFSDRRMGWIMPISSIISDSHDYVYNPHFCRYAFIAYQIMVLKEISKEDLLSSEFENLINELYADKGGIIFIYDKRNLNEDFKLEDYYASLFKYGYYLRPNYSNPYATELPPNHKIKIHKISKDLSNKDYVTKYFTDLCFENNIFVKFHMLYQVIELFIEDILIYSLEETLNKFKEKKIYTRSLRDRISRLEPERSRINLLIDICNLNNDDYRILHEKCTEFLEEKGRISEDFPFSLYDLRNFIVHDFRHITDEASKINDINYFFEMFILNLLVKYKHDNLINI